MLSVPVAMSQNNFLKQREGQRKSGSPLQGPHTRGVSLDWFGKFTFFHCPFPSSNSGRLPIKMLSGPCPRTAHAMRSRSEFHLARCVNHLWSVQPRCAGAAAPWHRGAFQWTKTAVCSAMCRKKHIYIIYLYIPIGSMYGIYGNIYHQYTPNVSIYTIHGSYGIYIYIRSLHLKKPLGCDFQY